MTSEANGSAPLRRPRSGNRLISGSSAASDALESSLPAAHMARRGSHRARGRTPPRLPGPHSECSRGWVFFPSIRSGVLGHEHLHHLRREQLGRGEEPHHHRPSVRRAGDSFELVSGVPSKHTLDIAEIDGWAGELHAAFPSAEIYAGTAGIAHLTTLASRVSNVVTGVFYDYEPGYEPEFTGNFSQSVSEFENASEVAHVHGLLSIGYPTGRPIASPSFRADNWSYGVLAKTVDELVVQTQTYCHQGVAAFVNATNTVLTQYAATSAPGAPTFQITLGGNASATPNQVTPAQAYRCTQVLLQDGLKSLYLWFGPGSNDKVVQFLKELGRT